MIVLPVKMEGSWNEICDNCRELVYECNCISMGWEDALPDVAEKSGSANRAASAKDGCKTDSSLGG